MYIYLLRVGTDGHQTSEFILNEAFRHTPPWLGPGSVTFRKKRPESDTALGRDVIIFRSAGTESAQMDPGPRNVSLNLGQSRVCGH